MSENKKENVERNLNRRELLRFNSSRVSPLDELEYVQGLISSRKTVTRVSYDEDANDKSGWNEAVLNIVKELRGSPSYYMNPLSTHLKLEEKDLDITSINIKDFEEPIKEYIKQKETIFNLRATLMRHKDLFLRWGLFATQVFVRSNISSSRKGDDYTKNCMAFSVRL